jgi:hypothetical protein
MRGIRMLVGPEPYNPRRLVFLGLLVAFVSLLPAAPATPAQDQKIYVSQKYGFSFQYPSAYDLKVTANCYLDFHKDVKSSFGLRVDERFIERLYAMVHGPGPVVYRLDQDPYRKLAQETRHNKKLFYRYARHEAQNWCAADGPDGSNYCRDIKSEKPFTSRHGLNCLELYLIMIREDYAENTKQQKMVGPVFGVLLPKEDLPLVLIISPRYRNLASPTLVQDMQQVIDSLKVTPCRDDP